MGYKGPISQRQRRFGEELQGLRVAAGLSAAEAGALVGMGGPAVSHTEAGRITLNAERLEVWLDAYGCTDPAYRATLAEMSRSAGKGWWSEYEGKVPALALDLAEAEDRSVRLANYEMLYIPGALQLQGYAEAIFEDSEGDWDIADAVRFRMARQRILDEGKEFHFVIHEAALRMRFPGDAVMRAQLLHLIDMAARPNVTVQVLPFTSSKKPPSPNSFLFCEPGSVDLSTIIVDGPQRAEHYGDPASITAYRRRFEQLKDLALPAVDTAGPRSGAASRDSWGILQHLLYLLQV
ncbi:helix-turn-helix transcriptional regulator [Kitasatospora sp. CM 4170]|uniref:Helix-turn-helix domain-containing protein n=1 Tax=Kitasatospora aburaviensis TaxID=67265 RepID=A0ABW1F3Q1_9ACTN|nr:helix-turn-helix transcriptional regulator [Kitasatospora sp. CM 4170]WNM46135.1 helix-turn-helix transcriptional regulator [Kitasatospora sp. CM 4170]